MSRYAPVLPFLALAVAVLWALSQKGPLTISISIPNAVHVHIDNPPALSSSRQPPAKKPEVAPPRRAEPDASILTAITSFANYHEDALDIIATKRDRFDRLPAEHRHLARAIGYDTHFPAATRLAAHNAALLSAIATHARAEYGFAPEDTGSSYYEIVSDFMGHVVRDWTAEGAAERAQIFPPILDALRHALADIPGQRRVLVPGFGLGRLAHEIASEKDIVVDACELDYGSVIAYRFLVNHTSTALQHTLYPFTNRWTQQRTATARFHPVRFPDVLPQSPVRLVEGDFLTQFPAPAEYDAVVTLFFIDVSENIIDFLEHIWRVLKPGGVWINLGPFKWGQHSQMQLSAEEVILLAREIGLDVDMDSRQSIDALYAHQPESLLKFTYVTQFWTARKRV